LLGAMSKSLIFFLCLLLVSADASASDMGNFPATLATWIIGSVGAFGIATFFSVATDQAAQKNKRGVGSFFVILFLLLIIVFFAGVLAFFT